ncbi:MAG: 3-phosphoglycerate dehydrogenase family protein [Bacilli bacterium]|nr:3-phosphoglycerate dehydrogenase family protein [Bacilli bacterium]
MKAFVLNNISKAVLNDLSNKNLIVDDVNKADSILVRSFEMKDYKLPDTVLAVARAGAGVNNIPFKDYAKKGIVVFNTPGANANAVKELTLCALFLLSRDIIGGKNWVDDHKDNPDIATMAEKTKAQFAGNEIFGKKIAVLGLGKIGILVANACVHLGMEVYGYDPYLSNDNARLLDKKIKYFSKVEDCINNVDFITIHVPAIPATKGMLNQSLINKAAYGVKILNFARDTLINEDDLEKLLNENKVSKYITDFSNPRVTKFKNTIILPHLGASTSEAEDNCAVMAINQLVDYIDNGNIVNSVNLPSLNAGSKKSKHRICIIHNNAPEITTKLKTLLSDSGCNIKNMCSKVKDDLAYTIIDVDELNNVNFSTIDNIIRLRII